VKADPVHNERYHDDNAEEEERQFEFDIEHVAESALVEHVQILDTRLSLRWEAKRNRGLGFHVRTEEPDWKHDNDMIADSGDSAILKKHAKAILELVIPLLELEQNGKLWVKFCKIRTPFAAGVLVGQFLRSDMRPNGTRHTVMIFHLKSRSKR
jgi:hypothetical protein